MDFTYDEEQEAVRELADRIFTERSTHERLKAVEAAAGDEGPLRPRAVGELAGAGLLGIGLAEDVGGAGLDFVAVCLVVEAAGRTAAHVPVVETMVYGAAAHRPLRHRRAAPAVAAQGGGRRCRGHGRPGRAGGRVSCTGGNLRRPPPPPPGRRGLAARRDQGVRPRRPGGRPGPGPGACVDADGSA